MNSSEQAFRDKFVKLMEDKKKMSPEQLTKEYDDDTMFELADAVE